MRAVLAAGDVYGEIRATGAGEWQKLRRHFERP